MTLTVNGQAAEPGCVVDGHWGQYGGDHLQDQVEAFDLTITKNANAQLARRIADRCEEYMMRADVAERCNGWRDLMYNAWEWQHEAVDALLELANEATEGGYWEWYEGECFLRSYVCPECGRDACNPREMKATATGHMLWDRTDSPCDYCCDADDPGCFA